MYKTLKATHDRSEAQKQIYMRCFETKAVKTMNHSGKSHIGRSVVWLILLISESNGGVTGFFSLKFDFAARSYQSASYHAEHGCDFTIV